MFAVIIHARYYDFYYPSKLIIIQFTSYILQNTMSNIDLGGIGKKNFIPVETSLTSHLAQGGISPNLARFPYMYENEIIFHIK